MSKFHKTMGAHILLEAGYIADLKARGITKKDVWMVKTLSTRNPTVYERIMEAYELDMNLDIQEICKSLNLK